MGYYIRALTPRKDISLGAHGFSIELDRDWPSMVALSGLDQAKIDHKIARVGNDWLDACGFGRMYDPDNPADSFDKSAKKQNANLRRIHEATSSIRVRWGEWGVEHIDVPGNACGLDLERNSLFSFFDGGRMLHPHNVDSWMQKSLLLIVFTEFAEDIAIFARSEISKREQSLYLLQNCTAGYLGDSPLFWKKGGCGYTVWIDEAERFSLEAARKTVRITSGTHAWRILPLGEANKHARRVLSAEDLVNSWVPNE